MCTRAGAIHGKHPCLIKERKVSYPGACPCDVESFALSRIDLDSGFNSFLGPYPSSSLSSRDCQKYVIETTSPLSSCRVKIG